MELEPYHDPSRPNSMWFAVDRTTVHLPHLCTWGFYSHVHWRIVIVVPLRLGKPIKRNSIKYIYGTKAQTAHPHLFVFPCFPLGVHRDKRPLKRMGKYSSSSTSRPQPLPNLKFEHESMDRTFFDRKRPAMEKYRWSSLKKKLEKQSIKLFTRNQIDETNMS